MSQASTPKSLYWNKEFHVFAHAYDAPIRSDDVTLHVQSGEEDCRL